ncbi:hypothetical protein GCM10012319_35870 [Comamonas sp. KCTC 72670]|nr:hypothetical protein GCM10012319_35870 [Comamonas sp. KCTC 72670]
MQRLARRAWVPVVVAGVVMTACGGAEFEEGSEPLAESAQSQAIAPPSPHAALSTPVVSVSCARNSVDGVSCTTSVTGGVPPYSYYWGVRLFLYWNNRTYDSSFNPGGATGFSYCHDPDVGVPPSEDIKPKVYVINATGARSNTAYDSHWFPCAL